MQRQIFLPPQAVICERLRTVWRFLVILQFLHEGGQSRPPLQRGLRHYL